MIEPPPDCFISGIAARLHSHVPKRSSLMQRQNSSSGASVSGPSFAVEPPALLKSTSSLPWCAKAVSNAFDTLSGSVTSHSTNSASPPAVRISAAIVSPRSTLRAASTVLAPWLARWRAVTSPMPPLAPVMNATLPDRRPMPSSAVLFTMPSRHRQSAAPRPLPSPPRWMRDRVRPLRCLPGGRHREVASAPGGSGSCRRQRRQGPVPSS